MPLTILSRNNFLNSGFELILEKPNINSLAVQLAYPILLFIALSITSCYKDHYVATFPDKPVNIQDVNSEFDDYNSTSPDIGGNSPLMFSTNRKSYGKNFNLIYVLLDVIMVKKTGVLYVGDNNEEALGGYAINYNLFHATTKVNSPFYDVLGPYLIPLDVEDYRDSGLQEYPQSILLFADNESGNFKIKYTENISSEDYSNPKAVTFLNSDSDNLYPCLNTENTAIYFCSNRNGDFDIYKTVFPKTDDILSLLRDTTSRTIIKDTVLSSPYDDKCPFITGNLMVFSSNRPGGYGGYDLYYSVFVDDKWSAPINFGEPINSKYDEYRPIIRTYTEFSNDMMIFSSNRPGGKGGYDLYYVGIKKVSKL